MNCAICLGEIETSGVRLECSHIFHLQCIDQCISRQNQLQLCPVCRQQFSRSQLQEVDFSTDSAFLLTKLRSHCDEQLKVMSLLETAFKNKTDSFSGKKLSLFSNQLFHSLKLDNVRFVTADRSAYAVLYDRYVCCQLSNQVQRTSQSNFCKIVLLFRGKIMAGMRKYDQNNSGSIDILYNGQVQTVKLGTTFQEFDNPVICDIQSDDYNLFVLTPREVYQLPVGSIINNQLSKVSRFQAFKLHLDGQILTAMAVGHQYQLWIGTLQGDVVAFDTQLGLLKQLSCLQRAPILQISEGRGVLAVRFADRVEVYDTESHFNLVQQIQLQFAEFAVNRRGFSAVLKGNNAHSGLIFDDRMQQVAEVAGDFVSVDANGDFVSLRFAALERLSV